MWQTNVFPSAQRRKMRLFEGYKRRAVVVVVADEEQTKRRALQEAQDGKDVPDSAILEMKGTHKNKIIFFYIITKYLHTHFYC